MAIKKARKLDNGITVTYHRVTRIEKVTNVQNVIEVTSYISEEARQEEKLKSPSENKDIYTFTDIIITPYDENIDIKNVYEFLITLDRYKDGVEV